MEELPIQTRIRKEPEYVATIRWHFQSGEFTKGAYSREHTWEFDGGIRIEASPSPHVVPAPWSNPHSVDPEEAFVASISSCHMLTFLYLASKAKYSALSYLDRAKGVMTKNAKGTPWVSRVVLSPEIEWEVGLSPSQSILQKLHEEAHEQCFIANSVKTEIVVQVE